MGPREVLLPADQVSEESAHSPPGRLSMSPLPLSSSQYRTPAESGSHTLDHSSPPFPSRGVGQLGPARVDHSQAAPSTYHRYVQLGCVAQGLLQHLALNFRATVWGLFGSWLRTMKTPEPPSEAVVAQALRNTLPQFLPTTGADHELKKFILQQLDINRCAALRLAG